MKATCVQSKHINRIMLTAAEIRVTGSRVLKRR